MTKSTAPLRVVSDRSDKNALRYPPRGFNPNVEAATWPFSETRKAAGDIVISSLAVTETRRAKTENTGFVRSMMARLAPKSSSHLPSLESLKRVFG